MGQVDLHTLYARHFGFIGIHLTKADAAHVVETPSSETEALAFPTLNEAEIKSILGHDIHFPIRMGLSLEDMQLISGEPLINISGSNKIIRTPLSKRKGTKKERTQLSDYVITIKGVLINEESEDYPEEQVARLREICENGGCYVESDLLRIFNIDRLAIEKWDMPSKEASQNEQEYTIMAYSDYPIALEIKEEDINVNYSMYVSG